MRTNKPLPLRLTNIVEYNGYSSNTGYKFYARFSSK